MKISLPDLRSFYVIALIVFLSIGARAQKADPKPPALTNSALTAILVQIVRAEDERRWDKTLENLLHSPAPVLRKRAALAAGRIGDDRAVPALSLLLEKDPDAQVRAMAAFALGETESAKAAEAILKALTNEKEEGDVRARAAEAAGKIAAANKPSAEKLGEAILDALDNEAQRSKQNKQLVLLGLTAVSRANPEEGDFVTAKFLTNLDAGVRATAANTLTRLRAKNANDILHALLLSDDEPVVRANAARALGAAEDKSAFNLLLEAALEDEDSRVRVSSIRALGGLKNAQAADKLLEHGTMLLAEYKKSKLPTPSEKNELLEIATTLGRLLPNSKNENAVAFLRALAAADRYSSSETDIALAKVDPGKFSDYLLNRPGEYKNTWQAAIAGAQGLTEWAKLEDTKENKDLRNAITKELNGHLKLFLEGSKEALPAIAVPDALNAYAAFKPDDLDEVLRHSLMINDVFVRAAAAGLLAEQPPSKANFDALKTAFHMSLLKDKEYNDAQLAMMDALFKIDKKNAVGPLLSGVSMPDYLVRKKAFELLRTPGLDKDMPGLPTMLESAVKDNDDKVKPYRPLFGTKLGQVLNTAADYTRAVSRKNGQVRAVITTEKGVFTIGLLPEDAPLTVDNFIKLANANYFNGVMVHRVVPNFVMQDGDPRGDGNGGPGWSIRCEINMVPFERGAVGMALSGKDTGGSQWFVTHSPQPHLDGGYTVFGKVNEADMKVVDLIARGDKIISIKIVEEGLPQKSTKKGKE